jgi:hypothetical protein
MNILYFLLYENKINVTVSYMILRTDEVIDFNKGINKNLLLSIFRFLIFFI